MSVELGLFGILGFLAYELLFFIAAARAGRKMPLRLLSTPEYYIILFCFSFVVFFVAIFFGARDLSAEIGPFVWGGSTYGDAIRAFLVGLAAVSILKKGATSGGAGVRVETVQSAERESGFWAVLNTWRNF